MLIPRSNLFRNFALCALLFSFATTLSAQSEKWKTYKYAEDGFRANFPSEPKLDRSRKQAKNGFILMNTYCTQAADVSLCIAVINQGQEATGLSPEALLGRTKLGLVSLPKTQKLNETEISLDGNKGVELEIENETSHIFTRLYVANKTLYQTMVTLPLGVHYPGTGRFLDAFHLITRSRY